MFVNYCDLCGQPMKQNDWYSLYLASPDIHSPDASKYETLESYYRDYENYLKRIGREVKEICPTCKHIFDKIFEYRLQGMSRLTEECEELFNLPPKIDKKKKDKEGNK